MAEEMTVEKQPAAPADAAAKAAGERIPRKVRDAIGRLAARLQRIEALLEASRPQSRRDEGRSPGGRTRPARPPASVAESPLSSGAPAPLAPRSEDAEPPAEQAAEPAEPDAAEDAAGAGPALEPAEAAPFAAAEAPQPDQTGGAAAVEAPPALPAAVQAKVDEVVQSVLGGMDDVLLDELAHVAGLPAEVLRNPGGTAAKAGAPGASTTPSSPPPAEDPARSAERRAEGVEAYLDAKFFGME
jgi:hypothetical protein